MIEAPSMYRNLSDQAQFRLKMINEIKAYFVAGIYEREVMIKRLSKYIAAFDYFDKDLTVLSATSGSVSIGSFGSIIGALVGIANASFSFAFSITTEIIKKKLKMTQNKKKKHNKIVMLARIKLNNIESTISKAIIGNEIRYENFTTIIHKERNYQELKKVLK